MMLISCGDGLEGPGESAAERRTGDAPVAGGAEKATGTSHGGVDDGRLEATPAQGSSVEAGSAEVEAESVAVEGRFSSSRGRFTVEVSGIRGSPR